MRTGIVFSIVLGLALSSCQRSGPQSAADFEKPETVCVADTILATVKSIIFDQARKLHDGDALKLNDLERGSTFKIEQAVLMSNDKEIHKVTCKGRAKIVLPTGVSELFDNDRVLEADIEYAGQPTADGKDSMIEVGGANGVSVRLSAADLSRWATATTTASLATVAGTMPASATLPGAPVDGIVITEASADSPSFACGPSNSAVEQLICSTANLRARDRELASAYRAALAQSSEYASSSLREEQRDWMRGRSACRETDCMERLYDERLSALAASN